MNEPSTEGVPPQEWTAMSVATKEAVQMREASQRRGMLVVKRNIAEAQAQGESYATFKARYRPVGIDGKLKDLWAEVAAQTRRDAVTSALITKETGITDSDTLQRAAAARCTPQWDRSDRNGGPSACRWCGASFGLMVWQYNCSACGWKVCGECSPNTMELTEWLEGKEPHELRRTPSNARLRVCVGCWCAVQATLRGPSALSAPEQDDGDRATAVKRLLLQDRGTLKTTLSELPREDLLLLVCVAVEAVSQGATDRSAEFLAEVSASFSLPDGPDSSERRSMLARLEDPQLETPSTAAPLTMNSTGASSRELHDLPLCSESATAADVQSADEAHQRNTQHVVVREGRPKRKNRHRGRCGSCCARPRGSDAALEQQSKITAAGSRIDVAGSRGLHGAAEQLPRDGHQQHPDGDDDCQKHYM